MPEHSTLFQIITTSLWPTYAAFTNIMSRLWPTYTAFTNIMSKDKNFHLHF